MISNEKLITSILKMPLKHLGHGSHHLNGGVNMTVYSKEVFQPRFWETCFDHIVTGLEGSLFLVFSLKSVGLPAYV